MVSFLQSKWGISTPFSVYPVYVNSKFASLTKTDYELLWFALKCNFPRFLWGDILSTWIALLWQTSTKPDYDAVRASIANILDADYEDGSYGPVLVRLAWHASGTFDHASGNGGSAGATMRQELDHNILLVAQYWYKQISKLVLPSTEDFWPISLCWSLHPVLPSKFKGDCLDCRFSPECDHGANAGLIVARDLLEPIKKQHPWISYADLWTLAGAVAIEEMGGLPVK